MSSTTENTAGTGYQTAGVSDETIAGLRTFGGRRIEQLPVTSTCKVCTNLLFSKRPSETGTIGLDEGVWVRRNSSKDATVVHSSCMQQVKVMLQLTGQLIPRIPDSDSNLAGRWEAGVFLPAPQVTRLLSRGVVGGSKDTSNAMSTINGQPILIPGRFWNVGRQGGEDEWFNWHDDDQSCVTMLEMLKASVLEVPADRKIAPLKRSDQAERQTSDEQFPPWIQLLGHSVTIGGTPTINRSLAAGTEPTSIAPTSGDLTLSKTKNTGEVGTASSEAAVHLNDGEDWKVVPGWSADEETGRMVEGFVELSATDNGQ